MTEHDEISSVDDDALASAAQTEPMDGEGSAVAPASPSQQDDRTSRVQQLIRDKRTAEALAANTAAQAAALRNRSQSAGRPQDYRAPEDYTRAVAEQAVREVGAEILGASGKRGTGDRGTSSAECLGGIDSRLPREGAGFRCRRSQPESHRDAGDG